jgi:hypothetical protein
MSPEDFPVNLDDATDLDLAQVESYCRHELAFPFALAHGLTVSEAREALGNLAEYARAGREARAARLAGQIPRAMVLERTNDDRYKELPACLQW